MNGILSLPRRDAAQLPTGVSASSATQREPRRPGGEAVVSRGPPTWPIWIVMIGVAGASCGCDRGIPGTWMRSQRRSASAKDYVAIAAIDENKADGSQIVAKVYQTLRAQGIEVLTPASLGICEILVHKDDAHRAREIIQRDPTLRRKVDLIEQGSNR